MGDMLAGQGLGAEQKVGLNFPRDSGLRVLAGARPPTVSSLLELKGNMERR